MGHGFHFSEYSSPISLGKLVRYTQREETRHQKSDKSLTRTMRFNSKCSQGLQLWMEVELLSGMLFFSYEDSMNSHMTDDEDETGEGTKDTPSALEFNAKGHVVVPDYLWLKLPEQKKLVGQVVRAEYGKQNCLLHIYVY
jgi:hypothetical protein